MNTAGLTMMLISWIIIILLCGWSVWKTVRADQSRIHAPLEIEDEELGTLEENENNEENE